MKTTKVVLGILAVLVSVGGSFATKLFAPRIGALSVYKVGAPGVTVCTDITDACSTIAGTITCQVNLTYSNPSSPDLFALKFSDCSAPIGQSTVVSVSKTRADIATVLP